MARLAVLVVSLALVATSAAAQDANRAARGHLLVKRYCASCHSVERSGNSPNPAAPAFRDLHGRYAIDDLAEALAEVILTGHPAMPEMRFPPQDVRAILAYIKKIQTLQHASARGSPSA